MPVHVDDGLVATNLLPLYQWVLGEMNKVIKVNDLGAALLYLGIHIDQNCPKCKLGLFQRHVVTELLTMYNLLNTHPSSVPLCHKLHALPKPPLNSLPDIPDSEIKDHYQHLISSLLYLMLCTWPDIAYVAMALGQLMLALPMLIFWQWREFFATFFAPSTICWNTIFHNSPLVLLLLSSYCPIVLLLMQTGHWMRQIVVAF